MGSQVLLSSAQQALDVLKGNDFTRPTSDHHDGVTCHIHATDLLARSSA